MQPLTKCGFTLLAELCSWDTQTLPRMFRLFSIPHLNQSTTEKYLPNFPTQKNPRIKIFKLHKSFDHPCLLKSRVPPWAFCPKVDSPRTVHPGLKSNCVMCIFCSLSLKQGISVKTRTALVNSKLTQNNISDKHFYGVVECSMSSGKSSGQSGLSPGETGLARTLKVLENCSRCWFEIVEFQC